MIASITQPDGRQIITRLIFFGFKDFAKTIYIEYNVVIRL